MDRPPSHAAQPNSCQHHRKHDGKGSWGRSDIQAQKPKPNHFQAKENTTRSKADEKDAPRRPVPYFQAKRNCSLHQIQLNGSSIYFCDEQGYCCGDAARQSCSEAGAAKTKRLDEANFANQSASHGS